jgi:hypothetical protein
MPTNQQDVMKKIKALSLQDKMIAGGGILAFIFSLFPFFGVSADGFSASVNAWHSYAILGLLLLLAAVVVRSLMAAGTVTMPDIPLPWPRALAIAAGVGTALILLRGLTFGGSSIGYLHSDGISAGMRFWGYLLVLCGVVVTAGFVWADRLKAGTPAVKTSSAAPAAEGSAPPKA